MKQIFDNYVETSFPDRRQAEFKFRQFEENYRRYFSGFGFGSKVLDIGIGRGEMLSCMRNWGYDYQGVDISPSTVELCSTFGLRCERAEDTAGWLMGKPGTFSVITCLDVVEHVPKEKVIEFLQAIRTALAPDGVAIIQVPNLQSPFGYLHHFNDFTHVNGFVEHSLAQVLIAAGFKRHSFHGFEEVFATGFKSRLRILLRWVYRRLVRFLRAVNANPNPEILDPVFYAVAHPK